MKFKYSKFIFELAAIPSCRICGSLLNIHTGYKQITYIDSCSNESCTSKNGTLNKYRAFLPDELCSIEIEKYRDQLSKKRKNSIEYWILKGYDEQTSKQKVFEFQQFASKKVKNRFVPTRENYKSLGYSDEEIDQKLLTPNKKAFWIKKGLSNDETEKKIKEFQGKISKRRHNKYRLAIDQNDKIEINRYKSQNPVNTEYWLLRGFSEDEAKQKVSERQATFTLKKCISKYGEEEGRKLWIDRQNKWIKNYRKKSYSFISQDLFWKLYEELSFKPEEIKFATFDNGQKTKSVNINNEEKLFLDTRLVLPDFIHIPSKKIIEFDGVYYHRKNPENRKREQQRDKDLERNGYKVLHVWESEYKQNPQATINKCITFLNS